MSASLPDEIISEILSPALKVSDEMFSDTSDVSPFAKVSLSTSAYLVVCRDWLRVATPLLYNVVVLRSRSQAYALEKVLQCHPEFGRFIKKLRVEGGYGMAMHLILKSAPNITDIFLSLAIWSNDGTQGLCKGLPLINPSRVILVDPWNRKALKNQNLADLTRVIHRCFEIWDNMREFHFPYLCASQYRDSLWMTRANTLASALAQSQTVHTIRLAEILNLPEFVLGLAKISNVKALWLRAKPVGNLEADINYDARLKTLVRYPTDPDPEPPQDSSSRTVPDIAPSLNPFFTPMESASEDTRERVWKRVLYFAMYVDEPRSKSFHRGRRESHPSRLPILLVSKYFNRLALPYIFDCPSITWNKAHLMAQQIRSRPELGELIRVIRHSCLLAPETMMTIFSSATKLQKYAGTVRLPLNCLEAIAKAARFSLQELSVRLDDGEIRMSLLADCSELRVLELSAPRVKFTLDSPIRDTLKNLHTLRIMNLYNDFSLLSAFSLIKQVSLESLHTLKLGPMSDPKASDNPVGFLNAHGSRLRHLTITYHRTIRDFMLFDVCKELLEVGIFGAYGLAAQIFSCETPHTSLTKIRSDNNLFSHPAQIDPTMFPALREIQVHNCEWPTTEREIAKSEWVTFAEAWLEHGIKLTDSEGQHWIPRVKRSRRR
ncbi:F-box domain-containing protein [Mycena venus]|uniref:F-box domain-containing protein n=1 Tax=Mycena venus TaxID=2733690 RepID=A0A8H7CLI1_9AGAR|nr:F-box domain-containing protein [Mycena venus]